MSKTIDRVAATVMAFAILITLGTFGLLVWGFVEIVTWVTSK